MSKERSFLLGWTLTEPDEEGTLRPGLKLGRRITETLFRLLLKMFGVKENNCVCVCVCVCAHTRTRVFEKEGFFCTSGAFLTLKLPLHGNRTPPSHHVETTGLGLPAVGQQDTPFGHSGLFSEHQGSDSARFQYRPGLLRESVYALRKDPLLTEACQIGLNEYPVYLTTNTSR